MYAITVDSNFIEKKEFLRPLKESHIASGIINMHFPELGLDFSCDSLIFSAVDDSPSESSSYGMPEPLIQI